MSLEISFLFFLISYENSRTMRKELKNRLFEEIQNINWQLLRVIELSYFNRFQCYKLHLKFSDDASHLLIMNLFLSFFPIII